MRVNVDDKALSDPRFARLAARLKLSRFDALGRCLPVWMAAYQNRSSRMAAIDIDAHADIVGFAKALLAVDLAQTKGKAIRLRGVDERIQFLLLQDSKRAKANAARLGLPREVPPGRNVDGKPGAKSGLPGERPEGAPYSPDQDQTPPLTQPQAEVREEREKTTAHALPVGWKPPAGGDGEKAEQKLRTEDPERAAGALEDFRRHCADKGRTSRDWDAAFAQYVERRATMRVVGGGRKAGASARRDPRDRGDDIEAYDYATPPWEAT